MTESDLLTNDPDIAVATLFALGDAGITADAEARLIAVATSYDRSDDARAAAVGVLARIATQHQNAVANLQIMQTLQELAAGGDTSYATTALTAMGSLRRWGVYPAEPLAPFLTRLETAMRTDDITDGERAFAQIRAVAPWLGFAWYGIGRLRRDVRQTHRALEALKEACRLRPRWSDSACFYARVLIEADDPGGAATVLERFREHSPRDPEAIYTLGLAYERTDREDEALALFEQAADTDGTDARYLAGVSFHLGRLGRYAEQVEWERRLLALAPEEPERYHRLAIALESAGAWDEAATVYGQLFYLAPDFIAKRGWASDGAVLLPTPDPLERKSAEWENG